MIPCYTCASAPPPTAREASRTFLKTAVLRAARQQATGPPTASRFPAGVLALLWQCFVQFISHMGAVFALLHVMLCPVFGLDASGSGCWYQACNACTFASSKQVVCPLFCTWMLLLWCASICIAAFLVLQGVHSTGNNLVFRLNLDCSQIILWQAVASTLWPIVCCLE